MTIAFAFITLQVLSAGCDLWTFRIPNIFPVAIASLFFIAALPASGSVDWISHCGAGALMFAIGALLFRFRLMGGGDVKLLAATALWTGFPLLFPFVALTAVFGGLFAIFLKLIAPSALALLSRLPFVNPRLLPQVLAAGREIPYGVAISGAALVLLEQLSPALLSF